MYHDVIFCLDGLEQVTIIIHGHVRHDAGYQTDLGGIDLFCLPDALEDLFRGKLKSDMVPEGAKMTSDHAVVRDLDQPVDDERDLVADDLFSQLVRRIEELERLTVDELPRILLRDIARKRPLVDIAQHSTTCGCHIKCSSTVINQAGPRGI